MSDKFHCHVVEIWSGFKTNGWISSADGAKPDLEGVGKHWFFVDLVEVDGGRCGVDASTDYGAMILSAEEYGRGYGVPVRDLVVGGAE